ncbi:hypothetical protein [Legionella tunisiensis]|uniref:hypothetical protein n=1 Tax=Legionella tunisiensis TaxID=1034944 RepID=UPI0012EA1E35|nr:hypothetical protein [Legionella tunisiensis]
MGENDARRGRHRKDFSMMNKSWEYISSYNEGYDKVALQLAQTNKRPVPSKSLLPNAKRFKSNPVPVPAPAMATHYADQSGQSIRNMPSYQKITIAGRIITVDAFLKRNYVFQDTQEKVSRRALYHAVLFENGTVTVNGRLIKWNTRIKSADISQLIKIGKGTPITRDAFLKRTYVFKDTGEVVSKKAQRAADIHEDGTATVNGKLIEWKRKSRIKGIEIGEKEVDETTVATPEMQGDQAIAVNEEEMMRAGYVVKEECSSLFSGDYEITENLEFDELWRMLIPDYINEMVNPVIPRSDVAGNPPLSSAVSGVPDSPGFDEFKRKFMADILSPEGNHFENGEFKTADLNKKSFQARKPYSPQFFSSSEKSEKMSTTLQVSEPNLSLEGDQQHDRDGAAPRHLYPAYFTQESVKAEKEEEIIGCTIS